MRPGTNCGSGWPSGQGAADETRAKLESRKRHLARLYEWGDIGETEYRAKMDETRMQLTLLPQSDKVRSFDEVAAIVGSLPAALDSATRTK